MGDPFKNVLSGASKMFQGAGQIAKGVGQAFGEAVEGVVEGAKEFVQDTVKEGADVVNKLKEGDLIGAGLELVDATSRGTAVANALDALGLVDDPRGKELISAAVNWMSLNPAGAVKDLNDFAKECAAAGVQNARKEDVAKAHTPPRPKDHIAKAPKNHFKKLPDAVRAKIDSVRQRIGIDEPCKIDNAGWAGKLPENPNDLIKRIPECINWWRKDPGCWVRIDVRLPSIGHEIDRHFGQNPDFPMLKELPRPCSFEDLVAAFMVDVVRDMQDTVRAKMEQMERMNAEKRKLNRQMEMRDTLVQALEGAGMVIGTLIAPGLGTSIGQSIGKAAGQMATGGQSLDHRKEELEDSRQLLFEELKNTMNKLQQMMSALSNVLKVMHDAAMSSIRNMR